MSEDDRLQSETTPKMIGAVEICNHRGQNANSGRLASQVDAINQKDLCTRQSVPYHRRKSDTQQQQRQSQFIDSLMAPKKFINQITIEPLAFLAILSLYIEFPSIQDLIYTKICLQVVSNHQNSGLTPGYMISSNSSQTNVPSALQSLINSSQMLNPGGPHFLKTISVNLNSTQQALDGRIQQQTTQQPVALNLLLQNQTNSSPTNSDIEPQNKLDYSSCNRLNKTAIPKSIRQEIASENSLFWLKYQIVICLLCALSCPYWGGMSDRIGRLIPLNAPIVAAILCNLISLMFGLLISFHYHALVHINWLYLGAVLVGLSGGQAVIMVNSFSFISDNSSVESRSKRVTVLESVIFISHSVGFYITKHIMSFGLVSWFNRHFIAFAVCILLNITCLLYSVIKLRHHSFHRFLNNFEREQNEAFNGDQLAKVVGGNFSHLDPSNLHAESQMVTGNSSDRFRELTASTPDDLDGPIARLDKRWAGWGQVLTFTYYKQTFLTATKPRESRLLILLLLLCGFISALCASSMLSLLYIYLRMDPFNWTTSQYSWWNSITSITRGIALVGLVFCMKFVKSWNVPDPLVAGLGFISRGIGLLMIATAQSSAIIDWSLVALVLSEFTAPPIRSLLSKLVIKEEVGKAYSCLGAIQMLCFLVGNVLFYLGYTTFGLDNFFRISFLLVGILQIAAATIMLFVYTSLRKRVMLI